MNFKNCFYNLCAAVCFFQVLPLYSNGVLTWDEAVSEMLSNSPRVRKESSAVCRMRSLKTQSSYIPNPIFAYSVENVFGSHHWAGWDSAESRYELEQAFELGGKRNLRMAIAHSLYLAEKADLESLTLALLNELHDLFVQNKAAEEKFSLSLEIEALAIEYSQAINEKIAHGKGSCIEKNKAEMALTHARIKKEKALLNLKRIRDKLSRTIGVCLDSFDSVDYPFYDLFPFSTYCDYASKIDYHPEIAAANLRFLAAWQQIKLEKAFAVPDLTLLVGYKTNRECNDKGMILGAAFPIPIFNQNQGNISRARCEYSEADAFREDLKLFLEKRLADHLYEGESALNEALCIQESLLKEASESYECTVAGFQNGKFDGLQVLDAKSIYLEIKEKYLDALLEYHLKVGDIEYLTSKEECLP
ncbi:TolC family protein [Criblamydia sequanensis]|uniref:Outer membrane efflux protein n=1 Tax=Candidatus Criblamydia sequanensis CRIB-18 TaxID=1437425 RepID=A0A090D0S8_9BACT|nr:TolC family protein [Criblamydia sequanensis]CDR35152.1 Outer membrane efflux protein [Criblamydia sequanensis CRIB-18]